MKFLAFLLSVFLLLSLTVTSFAIELENPVSISGPADEIENIELEEPSIEISETETVVPEETPEEVPDLNVEVEETNPDLGIEEGTITNISLMSVAPITPEDTSGLKAVLLEVIGDYDPVIVEYEYMNNNNYSSYLREVLPDYPWCASFLMLALFVYCIFRLGGALIG